VRLESILLALAAAAVLLGQQRNPAAPPAAEDPGYAARIFRSQCATCHGLDGTGSAAGPDLTSETSKHGTSDESLFRVITKGVPGTPMTAFALSGREVSVLIGFLGSLRIQKAAEKLGGSATRGRQLFEASECGRCHAVSGSGGLVGPDLSQIGARRMAAQLTRSVLDPDAEVAPDYWSLRARTKAGHAVTGRRLNEDTDSFQLLDAAGRLRSLWKEELAEYQILRTSPMPSFQGKLDRAGIDDLIAYLASLRGTQP